MGAPESPKAWTRGRPRDKEKVLYLVSPTSSKFTPQVLARLLNVRRVRDFDCPCARRRLQMCERVLLQSERAALLGESSENIGLQQPHVKLSLSGLGAWSSSVACRPHSHKIGFLCSFRSQVLNLPGSNLSCNGATDQKS